MALTFSQGAKPKYLKWQEKLTKLAEQKRQQNIKAGVSALMFVANAGLGMYSASRGATSFASQFTQGAAQSIIDVGQANKESGLLENAMKEMTDIFSTDLEPQTITLEGSVYTLTGNANAQMLQVRNVLRDKILADLAR